MGEGKSGRSLLVVKADKTGPTKVPMNRRKREADTERNEMFCNVLEQAINLAFNEACDIQ